MKYVLFVCVVASIALFAFAGSGVADPNLADVPKHRHFIEMPSGKLVQVGPRVCDDPSLQDAFNQFHYNVHHSFSGPTTPVPTLGPQDGAPGLHSINSPVGLVLRMCSFTG
jgi:hypothetical protein